MEPSSPPPKALKPLTDPADLMQLLGRLFASVFLFGLTIIWIVHTSLERDRRLFMTNVVLTATTGIISLMWQRGAIKLWRRLRDERLVSESARATEAVNRQETRT